MPVSMWLCSGSDPERTVRDVDSPPGDHDGVFHRLLRGVAAGVGAVAVIFNLYINRSTITVL